MEERDLGNRYDIAVEMAGRLFVEDMFGLQS
jgi:hypothetical protein